MPRSLFILSLVALMVAVGYYYERRAQQANRPANKDVAGTIVAPQESPAQRPAPRANSGAVIRCDAKTHDAAPNRDIDAVDEACGTPEADDTTRPPGQRVRPW